MDHDPAVVNSLISGTLANTPQVAKNATGSCLFSPLEQEVIEQTAQRRKEIEETEKSTTHSIYPRQLKRYECWWSEDQARRLAEAEDAGASYEPIESHPITCVKETSDGKAISNTSLSQSSILQAVSALEHYRLARQDTDLYRLCPESRTKLRDYPAIRHIEQVARRNESKRQNEGQETKANGAQSQTITRNELKDVALGLLSTKEGHNGNKAVVLAVRDRTMLLVATSMAMRGDNVRSVGWSDFLLRKVMLINMGDDYEVEAFAITSNQGKMNKEGRIDFHSAFRHRHVELCAVGAVAMQMFSYFHIQGGQRPDFAPDFDHPLASNVGYRAWYDWLLFPGKSQTEQMSRDTHIKRVNAFKIQYNIFCQKVTHTGRTRGAEDGMEFGATVEGVQKLGKWSQGNSFQSAYNRTLPVDAMLALAHFNADRADSYFIAREHLQPPDELLAKIFPFIEEEESAYHERLTRLGIVAKDNSLVSFLKTLRFFRLVLLQDVAAIASKQPNVSLLRYPPFNTPEFLNYTCTAGSIIQQAEAENLANLRNLPEHLSRTFAGHLNTFNIQQKLQEKMLLDFKDDVTNRLNAGLQILASSGSNSKKRKALSQVVEDIGRARPLAPSLPLLNTTTSHLALPSTSIIEDTLGSATIAQASQPSATSESTSQTTGTQQAIVPVISGQGNVYSSQVFPLSNEPDECSLQMKAITELEQKFSVEKIKQHNFIWTLLQGGRYTWLPFFRWWQPKPGEPPSVADIWKEYSVGIGNRFSIVELTENWEARWKRNEDSVKSEFTRRNKIYKLVNLLIERNSWSAEKALDFLQSEYPMTDKSPSKHLRSSRYFCDWLNKARYDEILITSQGYLSSTTLPSL